MFHNDFWLFNNYSTQLCLTGYQPTIDTCNTKHQTGKVINWTQVVGKHQESYHAQQVGKDLSLAS